MSDPTDITVVTERGQVSIPSHLRRELALGRGRKLLWQKVGDRELRVTVIEEGRPAGARAMLGFARRFRSRPRRTSEWMKELRGGEER
ncbi:MAG TPA: sporulation regulator [Thermoanaerobaculia bacterium]|nr:sporulation regulator [Thermoanaerobaculia bacterium]